MDNNTPELNNVPETPVTPAAEAPVAEAPVAEAPVAEAPAAAPAAPAAAPAAPAAAPAAPVMKPSLKLPNLLHLLASVLVLVTFLLAFTGNTFVVESKVAEGMKVEFSVKDVITDAVEELKNADNPLAALLPGNFSQAINIAASNDIAEGTFKPSADPTARFLYVIPLGLVYMLPALLIAIYAIAAVISLIKTIILFTADKPSLKRGNGSTALAAPIVCLIPLLVATFAKVYCGSTLSIPLMVGYVVMAIAAIVLDSIAFSKTKQLIMK